MSASLYAQAVRAGFTRGEFEYQITHQSDDRGKAVAAVSSLMIALATVAVGMRFVARKLNKAPWQADDYATTLSLLLAYVLFAIIILSVQDGLGKHALRVGLNNVPKFSHIWFIFGLIYPVTTTCIKVSILLLYDRIFVASRFRLIVRLAGVFIIAYGISIFFATLFQCTPIQYSWNKKVAGSCVNARAFLVARAVITMLTDLFIYLMPVPVVWGLKINTRQKLAVCAIFFLGGGACAACITRLRFMTIPASKVDPTWTNTDPGIWALVEVNLGVICACVPCYRPLFRMFGERLSSVKWSSRSKTLVSWGSQTRNASTKMPSSVNTEVPSRHGALDSDFDVDNHSQNWSPLKSNNTWITLEETRP